MSHAPVVVLVGPPGAGKTTVGRLLAERLGVELRDTDVSIEAALGKSIADIFVEDGEAAFRDLEREEVAAALAQHAGVLALGGGSVLDAQTAERLHGHRVVFLSVGIADAAKRVGFDRSRPLLAVNPRASWVRLMEQRRPTYQLLSQLEIDTAGRTPEQVVQDIVAQLSLDAAGE